MSTAATALALPAGESRTPPRSLALGGLLGGVAALALTGTLVSAYIGIRAAAEEWPPEGFEVDGFLGVMLTLTALMTGVFAAWALVADGRGQRRQAAGALSLAAFVGICLLNGVWYAGTQLGLPAASSPFATLNYALLGTVGVILGAGIVGLVAALAKVWGRQAGPADRGPVRAAVWYWETALLCWVAVWASLYLLK